MIVRRLAIAALASLLLAAVTPTPVLAAPPQDTDPAAADEANADDDKDSDEKKDKGPGLDAGTFSGLSLRGIGPALMSGRLSDIAVDPTDRNRWLCGTASGGLWETTNAGTTWTPRFDSQKVYSIGCVTFAPSNPNVVWVGSGENNSQRSVAYGDGVYKSIDGGRTYKNVGLGDSEHIGKILVHPTDENTVYVAAQGPLWRSGGERGLYKTTDGGKKWKRILDIDEHTGVSDLAFDPRDPDVIYAVAYQRRRHVWTLINGGPGSGVHKTTDGGKTWKKLGGGLPGGEVGRIGIAVSPQRPDVVYAVIEAVGKKQGFYRSADAGATWKKQSGYVSTSPQYYNELWPCPHRFDRVYSADTYFQVTDDGGKNFAPIPHPYKHVDNHALAFDPNDPNYLLCGSDGGIYQSWDRGKTWRFTGNLPITQFYKICVDNASPFYNIYGGTQDNNTQGGPTRTRSRHGITNEDWFITVGGDGFKPQVDPTDPNTVYSQWQYGNLVRFDRATGSRVNIKPEPDEGEVLKWNWDSALLISPHANTRLYFGANRLFRSDDRGDNWRAISPDLTRGIDRNTLEVMGRVWGVDTVAKNRSTSFFGNIVSVTESPVAEGVIYAGADDGLVSVTEDGGESWRKVESIDGVPKDAYVADLEASLHDANVVFGCFNNHKMGDFRPYVMRSDDRGRTWTSIAANLPEKGSAWCIAQDHVDPNLLFVGTEFGVFFSPNGGEAWVRLKSGIPTIAVRDLEIQRREGDLAVGTFGRGFYVLDDYSPLRGQSAEKLRAAEATLYPVKTAWLYTLEARMGGGKKASQGDAFFTAPNPPFGAVFTVHVRDGLTTKKNARKKAEKKLVKAKKPVGYPSWDELRAEDREEKPRFVLTVSDADGTPIRRIDAKGGKGFHRIAWNLRHESVAGGRGRFALPGTYRVQLSKIVDGVESPIGEPQTFAVEPLPGLPTLPAEARAEWVAFHDEVDRFRRVVGGTGRAVGELTKRLDAVRDVLDRHPRLDRALARRGFELRTRLQDVQMLLNGDRTISSRSEPTTPSIRDRVGRARSGEWNHPITGTQRKALEIAKRQFGSVHATVTSVAAALDAMENALEAAGAPWTPGRIPKLGGAGK